MLAHANPAVRYTLGALLGFVALNAFAGGAYGLAGAESVPRAWLEGSPFHDYFFPGLILLTVVGGASWLAAIAVFARWAHARAFATAASAIIFGWIVVQVAIIGAVSPLQPFIGTIAVVIGVLAQLTPIALQQRATN